MKLDILGQKMITFDRSQSRGAYARETLHINHFETSWQIPGPYVWGIRKIHIPSQNDDDLYPCIEPGRQGRQKPRGRVVNERPGVLYRNHITPLDKQLNSRNVLFLQGLWQFRPWGVILQLCGSRVL